MLSESTTTSTTLGTSTFPWWPVSEEADSLLDAFTLNTHRSSLFEWARTLEIRTGFNPMHLFSSDFIMEEMKMALLRTSSTRPRRQLTPLFKSPYAQGSKWTRKERKLSSSCTNLTAEKANVATINNTNNKGNIRSSPWLWPKLSSNPGGLSMSGVKARSETNLELQLDPEVDQQEVLQATEEERSKENNEGKTSTESGFCDDLLNDEDLVRVAKAVSQAHKVARKLRDRSERLPAQTLLPPLLPLSLSSGLETRASSRTSTSSSSSSTSPTPTSRYAWRSLESQLLGVSRQQLQHQLMAVQRLILSQDVRSLGKIDVADLTLAHRGVTALSLAVSLGHVEVVVELLVQLSTRGQLQRALTTNSWLKATLTTVMSPRMRRETPLITACRLGHLDVSALLLLQHEGDQRQARLEMRDGNNCTALFSAVINGHLEVAALLIRAGAKVFYRDNDPSCPLHFVCRHQLHSTKGRQMVRLLVSHGANVEHVDLALRSPLFWAIYNDNPAVAIFLIASGARVRRWSWLEPEALPPLLRSDACLKTLCSSPMSLRTLTRSRLRKWLISMANGTSIASLVDTLGVDDHIKADIKLWTIKMDQDEL